MKKFLIFGLLIFNLGGLYVAARTSPLWMRYPAISPDGRSIVFSYKGDLFKVPVTGGRALQLTSDKAYDTRPVWSPDGKHIAFASNREGNFDIYLLPAEGGVPVRLTTHSAHEYPMAFAGNSRILFSANIQPDIDDVQFPSRIFPQTYSVDISGGRPVMLSSLAMSFVRPSADGRRYLYTNIKGYEDPYRKHQYSSVARDIWLWEPGAKREYRKLTGYYGEDREPVWSGTGDAYYFLSERNGSFNIYYSGLETDDAVQLTYHKNHPVRDLSISNQGLMAYSYAGEIYTLKKGGEPHKVDISIVADNAGRSEILFRTSKGASDMAVSPNGKEIAFVLRGDVFVTSVDYATTKRITNTPGQERSVEFSPDGRSLVYASEREGMWNIYRSFLADDKEEYFTYAHNIKEERITDSGKPSFQPLYSPDGKEIAYLENRTARKVINLKTRKTRTVLDEKYNYSYADGDQYFRWSPDGKYLLTDYMAHGGWYNRDVAVVKADGSGEPVNLTRSGYVDGNAKWVMGGKAMIWFTDRAGYRSHGSWGSQGDIYIMFFDRQAYEEFKMSKEEREIAEKDKKEVANKKEEGGKKSKSGKDKKKTEKIVELDFEHSEERIIRLTINSSFLADALLSPRGDKLYYLSRFESGYDLWVRDFREDVTRILAKKVGRGRMIPDKTGDSFFILAEDGIKKVGFAKGDIKPVAFNAEFVYKPEGERTYIFEHVWQQVKDKLYAPDYNGVDWDFYRSEYVKYLPHINNNFDFADMLSELLGELNVSHTGARFFTRAGVRTACFGAFFDRNHMGDGLKIQEILPMGPLDGNRLKPGDIILSIEGTPLLGNTDYYPLLADKAGKKLLLTVESGGKKREVVVKPISQGDLFELLYKRWVKRMTATVERISGGRLAYVHVRGMDSESFRTVYSEILGKYRSREAVIVDTRHNGGGWLHDDLAQLLSGREYCRYTPRGRYIGSDPIARWTKPSCVLVSEDNYSDAHGFPFVYRFLKIGKLIGAPVPGTMTAVWWESQIDPSIVFGIPQVGVKSMEGDYMENKELIPDIVVYNFPGEMLKGVDRQLETAVREMLKEADKQ